MVGVATTVWLTSVLKNIFAFFMAKMSLQKAMGDTLTASKVFGVMRNISLLNLREFRKTNLFFISKKPSFDLIIAGMIYINFY